MFTGFSVRFWRQLSFLAGLLVLATIFGLLAFMANLEVKDLDLWLHIGMGRYIVQHQFQVPHFDILSCTLPPATPWINHEWLFQVIVYGIHHFWGFEGLINFQVTVVSLTLFVLVLVGYSRENQLCSLLVLLLVSLVYESRLTIRPDLFSLLFLALFVLVLGIFINHRSSPVILAVIQVLWTNIHGFFFVGPFLVGLSLLGEWIKRVIPIPPHWSISEWKNIGRLTDEEYKRLKIILFVVIAACFINPFGWQGALYPLKIFFHISGDSKIFFEKIIELQKPITLATLWDTGEWASYKSLIIISFLSFVFNRYRLDIGLFIFWLFFLVFSLAAVRNVVFFAFAAYFVTVINVAQVDLLSVLPVRFTHKKFKHLTSLLLKVGLIFWIINYYSSVANNGYFDFDKYERKSEFGGISLRQYPIHAADFLVKNKVRGNFFNDFNSGAYFIGRCYPDIKVFIDGRTEVYGPAFFNYYRQLTEFDNAEKLTQALRRFQITGAFMNSVHNPIPPNTLNSLYKDKDWVMVYLDYDGVIFLKDIPLNRDVISRCRLDPNKLKAREMDLYRLGAREITPYQNLNRAFTYESLGLTDLAKAEAKAALQVNPGYPGPYKLLGKIAASQKDFEGAFLYFRTASAFAPMDQNARVNMAQSLMDLRRYSDAALQFAKCIDRWPELPRPYFRLAKINFLLNRNNQGFSYLSKGYKLDPKNSKEVLDIGELLLKQNKVTLAQKCFSLVIECDPHDPDSYINLSKTFNNNKAKAIEVLQEGLKKAVPVLKIKDHLRHLGVAVPGTGQSQVNSVHP